MTIAAGTQVRQVLPTPVEGVVVERNFNESVGEMQYRIEAAPVGADTPTWWFLESQIEVI